MTLTGPDVSHHQGDVNMRAVRNDGRHTFVGIKVSEGASYIDPQFRRNRDHARDAGLIRLLYHFGRPGKTVTEADARSEAAYFCGAIGQLEPGEIAVLDIEDSAVASGVNLGPWSLAFLEEVDRRTGRAGGSPDDDAELYTYGPYATAHLRLSNHLAGRDLWLAAYSSAPRVPAPWKSWTFWQWTSNGTCPGIAGRCDLNKFTGPLDALNHLAGIWPASPTTPQEAIRMGYVFAEIVRGFAGAWPNGRWTFYAVTAEGRVDVLNDVSQLGGHPSAFHWGDTGGTHLNAPVVGFEQLLDDNGHATGYVLLAADGGTFQYGTGVPA